MNDMVTIYSKADGTARTIPRIDAKEALSYGDHTLEPPAQAKDKDAETQHDLGLVPGISKPGIKSLRDAGLATTSDLQSWDEERLRPVTLSAEDREAVAKWRQQQGPPAATFTGAPETAVVRPSPGEGQGAYETEGLGSGDHEGRAFLRYAVDFKPKPEEEAGAPVGRSAEGVRQARKTRKPAK
jgi:hypothetical protein